MTPNHKQAAEAVRFIREADRFLVVSHVNPDGDAIGSTLGVAWMLKQLGKEFHLVNASPVPAKFRFLPGAEWIRSPEELRSAAPFSRVIAVDAADAERMGEARSLIAEDAQLLNIDHHATNDRFGTSNWVVPDAAATAQVLANLVEALKLRWEKPLAACLYTGLLTDTGGFRYSNTTPAVLELASHLLKQGVHPAEIADRVMETMTQGQLALTKRALDTLAFSDNGQVGWMWLKRRDFEEAEASEDEMDGIVNYARNVEGVDVGILFRETEDGAVKVSLRSREKVDVGELAKSFGGGGHARAAGCTLEESPEKVEQMVLSKVSDALKRGSS
jgi:bifunctional oligoribonuclease and PAP phosphatase NrnA